MKAAYSEFIRADIVTIFICGCSKGAYNTNHYIT